MDISIAICDDDYTECEYLQQLIKEWAKLKELDVKIFIYPSAEAVLFANEESSFDIALLDIRMGDMNGIELAKHLRQEDDHVQIVFITGLPDFIADGYEVAALHYLMKPVSNNKLADVLDRAVKRLAKEETTVLLPVKEGKQRLPVSSIYYAEVFSHDLHVYTIENSFSVKMTMNELEKVLGQGFFRCHRSFLVNMHRVRKVTKNSLEIENGNILPLSRKLATRAVELFIDND